MHVIVIDPPASGLISLQEAKDQMRVIEDDDDALIQALILAASGYLDGPEGVCGRCVIRTGLRLMSSGFPEAGGRLELPFPNLLSVESVKYYDSTGALKTLAPEEYRLAGVGHYGFIELVAGDWPRTHAGMSEAVQIDYTAGYGGADAIPEALKHAVKLHVSQLYEHTDAAMTLESSASIEAPPNGYEALISPFRTAEVRIS